MSEAGVFLLNILLFLIDLATLGLIGGIFYVIGLAVITMARNQRPNWETILYVVLILLSAIWLIRWYPRQVIVSIRVALQESRPEADLLREELKLWLPGTDNLLPNATLTPLEAAPTPTPVVAQPEIVVPIVVSGTVTAATATLLPMLPTHTPYPTYTPWPTATEPPSPTPCLIQVGGNWLACPPTPPVPGGE